MPEKTTSENEENLYSKYLYDEQLYNHTDDDDGIDIVTLRYTLVQCRKQLLISINSLFHTEFVYGKVELREDFEQLNNRCDWLKNENNLLRNNLQDLLDHCKVLVRQTTDILDERNEYYTEWQYVRNILTPRPDWDKCSNIVKHWSKQSIGKSSEQLVDVLIDELVHGNTEENNEAYLPVMINTQHELKQKKTFLDQLSIDTRSNIKNRHMRRRITGLLIKEIWSNKLCDENKLEFKSNIKLTDYVFEYLTKRFNNKSIAIEIGYNMQDACHRYRHNYQINLFWQILTGQMEENVYHYEMKEFARILQCLIKVSSKSSTQSFTETIPWLDFTNVLRDLYPKWTNEQILLLINSAGRDSHQSSEGKSDLNFLLLFMEDDEGHVGEFLMTVREQLQLDKNAYIEKIKDLLIGQPLVSMKQFKQAIQLVDPHISKNELQRYVSWVFESKRIVLTMNKGEMRPTREMQLRDFEEIILRLERCSCFMH